MTTIQRILVPSDFSKNAQAAFRYALDLAEKHNASIEVIHVYMPLEANELVMFDDLAQRNLAKRLQDFVANSIEEEAENGSITLRKTKVNAEVVYGEAVDTIVEWSKRGFDLVVMGSKSGGDFVEIFFGSVTTKVAQEAHCPVLVVPQKCTYHKIKNVLYACDFKHTSMKHPALVADVTQLFKAKLDVVFVQSLIDISAKDREDIKDLKTVFATQAPHLKVTIHTTIDDDVFQGVHDYAHQHQSDLIVMVTAHRTFLQNTFHSSATKEVAMYTDIPLLILKSKN